MISFYNKVIFKSKKMNDKRKTITNRRLNQTNLSLFLFTIRKIVVKTIEDAWLKVKWLSQVQKQEKQDNIERDFLNHCSTLIQTQFRRYSQQKKYKKFLPIYRRFKELLWSAVQGWRTRRIMQLKPMKEQIKILKQKVESRPNLARIAKREFIDQVHRLIKKGTWIQQLKKGNKQQNIKTSSLSKSSKENHSLYGNIKSISLKNAFSTSSKKPIQQNLSVNKKDEKKTIYSQQNNKFDQMKVKGYDFQLLLENKLAKQCSKSSKEKQKVGNKQPISRQKLTSPSEVSKKNSSIQLCDSKISIIEKYCPLNEGENSEREIFRGRKKKLNLTLAKSQLIVKDQPIKQGLLIVEGMQFDPKRGGSCYMPF